MRTITSEDEKKIIPHRFMVRTSPLRRNAFALSKGESIFLPRWEWKGYKYSPKTTVPSLLYNKEKKFSCFQVRFGKQAGYQIKRVK